MDLKELYESIQKWIVEEYSPELQKWITDSYSQVLQEWIEEYVDEKINTALLNIPKDTEQHSNYSDGEWKVYRIKEIGKRLNDLGLTDKWQSYTYLYPEVYLTKEAAENHKPSDLHCDTAHATYEIIEQTVINK